MEWVSRAHCVRRGSGIASAAAQGQRFGFGQTADWQTVESVGAGTYVIGRFAAPAKFHVNPPGQTDSVIDSTEFRLPSAKIHYRNAHFDPPGVRSALLTPRRKKRLQ